MELRHLRYFIQVASDLHFARAATRLGISQPPLSQQIRQLEDEIGVRLFERTSRRVALTPAGTLFLDAARETIRQADRAVEIARRAARGELGALMVGFNPSAPFIPQVALAINAYRRTYPDVQLSLTEMAAPDQILAVESRALDIGFVRHFGPPALPEAIASTRLLSEGLFVAMRADHPLATRTALRLADIAGEPMVVYGRDRSGCFSERLFAMIREGGQEPVIAQRVGEASTLLGLVAAGVGVTIVAASLCALQSTGLTYLPLLDAQARTDMWLIHHRHAASLPCRHFITIVEEALAADHAEAA
jgi:DNA-binding transcriptional LysR family regulator